MVNYKALVPAVFLSLAASTGSAHDLWLVPTTTKPPVGASIRILAQTGMELGKSLAALAPDRIDAFFIQDSAGRHDITPEGTDEDSLVATVRLERAGVALAALAIKPRLLKLKAEEFNHYLEEDGLPQILALRKEKGEMHRSSREMYAKFAKVILRVGEGGPTELATSPVGLRLEIVPETDPGNLKVGESLPVRVLFEGRPLPGVYVYGLAKGESKYRDGRPTDVEGRSRLVLARTGLLSLHCIYMRPHADAKNYDWESFFATLTFETGAPTATSP